MKTMVEDHDKDVKEFEEASQKVKDPDLKTWTDTTLGVIKQHQQMAHDLVKKLK
jgi:putative membrane protein